MLAQSSGFLGKKNLVNISASASIPLSYNLFVMQEGTEYSKFKIKNDKFERASNQITSGFAASLSRVVSNTVALGIEYRQLNFKCLAPGNLFFREYDAQTDQYTEQNSPISRIPFLKVYSTTFSPYIEWTKKGGLLPIGLIQQIGVNYHSIGIKDDEFRVRYTTVDSSFNLALSESGARPNQYTAYKKVSVGVNYKIQLRIPITEALLFNVGIRYHIGFYYSKNEFYNPDNELANKVDYTYFNNEGLDENIKRSFRYNMAQIESGLSFAF